MKRRPLIMMILIILLPLAALIWAGLRIAENEKLVVQERFRDVMLDRLLDVNNNVSTYFDDVERVLGQVVDVDSFDIDSLREVSRTEPRITQLFVLDVDGQLNYPDPTGPLNGNERLFLLQAAKMFTGQDLKDVVLRAEQQQTTRRAAGLTQAGIPQQADVNQQQTAPSRIPPQATRSIRTPADVQALPQYAAPQPSDEPEQELLQKAYGKAPVQNLKQFKSSSGWFVWYWDRGLNLIYWKRQPSGHIVGCALERARWMSDLIAQLPETVDSSSEKLRSLESRVRLVNSSSSAVYQWGNFEPDTDERPFCEVPVGVPLASWRLQCFVPIEQLTAGTGRSAYFSLFGGLAAMTVALAVIAFLFVREYTRDMNEAAQQVSFVNQVSHELKTPLTNIRMYAELLGRDLDVNDDTAEKPRQRLAIILSEGQRLSRLIGNVLTFARQQRKTLQVQPQAVVPDQIVEQIVDRFRPALTDQQIEVELNLAAAESLSVDPDFLEQILGNLISNVEKYAGSGRLLSIESSVDGEMLTIDVGDAGPGIEKQKQATVFEPFLRVSNNVSYAAGTGIGLPIARELARLHGGDLVLLNATSGCLFRATLLNQTSSK